MIPLILPVLDFKDVFTCYGRKGMKFDRSGILAKDFGQKHAFFVSEGREALAMALENLRLKKEDEVIVPSYICDIVPKVVERFATVVYADIDRYTLVVGAEEIRKRITRMTKAVIVAHMYGKVGDLKNIFGLCKEMNIALIEDCAQAIYSFDGKTRAGSLGDYTILSFRFSKDVGLLKGGALLTDEEIQYPHKIRNSLSALFRIVVLLVALRSQRLFIGRIYYYIKESILIPFFSKTKYSPRHTRHELSHFEQELALAGLRKMPDLVSEKKRVASLYVSKLKEIDGIELCDIMNNSLMRFNILASNREPLIKRLHKDGIESDKMYSYSMSRNCMNSQQVSERIVNLPVHPGVSERDVERICRTIRKFYSSRIQ